ncbi:hypothetical protein B0A49_04631 [Cryomyces minteri]|uniref:Uncharacterized protein n=1 Tax=Cryomyces minteri TaxID=331657 RepID=A0A4U0XG01_9PEZI|nr:hypothetical protein B0A49_04631 [Cryomyces minteri]
MPPHVSSPIYANFPSSNLTIGAGVAIFHLASARVVVCYHSRDKYWFLPKGRRDVNEETGAAAEREGFEESGYRNRLLPLPLSHRQPRGSSPITSGSPYATEPVWTQLIPQSASVQYLLFWYVAETVPADVEAAMTAKEAAAAAAAAVSDSTAAAARTAASASPAHGAAARSRSAYVPPPPFPPVLPLRARVRQDSRVDGGVCEPVRHAGTGVDAEELLYESQLLPIAEARRKLRGSVMADVVRVGWEAVGRRLEMEGGGGDEWIDDGAGAGTATSKSGDKLTAGS